MTTAELARYIHRKGRLTVTVGRRTDCLTIPIQVKDAKWVWGRLLYLVQPIGGNGELWVNAARVELS